MSRKLLMLTLGLGVAAGLAKALRARTRGPATQQN
jgi:hypothetical protein